eukprot:TCALIF_02790-PA protein Name:"Protein of unknown function" AED:0.08 eAED:0.08 QI:0/0/0.5/0.5/1/1/2/25/91
MTIGFPFNWKESKMIAGSRCSSACFSFTQSNLREMSCFKHAETVRLEIQFFQGLLSSHLKIKSAHVFFSPTETFLPKLKLGHDLKPYKSYP